MKIGKQIKETKIKPKELQKFIHDCNKRNKKISEREGKNVRK